MALNQYREDLLGDDLGDQSLADYNLGNEEEEQLLADDYEGGGMHNVPASVGEVYSSTVEMVPLEYSSHMVEYPSQPMPYQPIVEAECVVPNITVEVPNVPHSTYAPIEPRHYEAEHAVPPAIPAGPIESPQIVPSEITATIPNSEPARERFISERPVGAQRMPQVRDIPDSLDKVVIPRGGFPPRGRTSWRNPQFNARFPHPYRRNNMHRGNFQPRNQFPPPQQIRPHMPPQMRPEIRPDFRPEMSRPDMRPEMNRPDMRPEMNRPDMRPEMSRPDMRLEMNRPDMRPEINRPDMRQEMSRPDMRPEMNRPNIRLEMDRPDIQAEMNRADIRLEMERPDIRSEMNRPDMRPEMIRQEMNRPDLSQNMPPRQMGPEISPERPILPDMSFRPPMERQFQPFHPRFQFRPDERPMFNMRPPFERPMYPYPRQFNPRFPRHVPPHIPQVTIRQPLPENPAKEPEVRMLPVPLPPNLPPAGLAGKKVLINPHFKGNFPPVEGLPAYIPTRIQKSPPLSPTLENKFGPIKDIDDAAERFIAEQRNALAKAAGRKFPRRSPQRYIENTTIEIENELAHRPARRRSEDDDDLLRRQEEFISANRAGLRRRMRSPSPPPARRSPSPSPPARRSPERRARPDPLPPRAQHYDEDNDYKRRLREQESLRERVLRAKEVRRRKNAVAMHKQIQERERDNVEKSQPPKDKEPPTAVEKEPDASQRELDSTEETKPDTTRKTPERKTPERKIEEKESKSVESDKGKEQAAKVEKARERSPVKDDEVNSTCETLTPPRPAPPLRALTPPLPPTTTSDDELDLILGDIDGILSDDEDSGRFKEKAASKPEPVKPKPMKPMADLRSKLPPKPTAADSKKQRQKIVFGEERDDRRKKDKSPARRAVVTSSTKADDSEGGDKQSAKTKLKTELTTKNRQRIIFENKQAQEKQKEKQDKTPPFSNRRVILQRKITKEISKSIYSRIEVTNDPTKPNPGIFSRAVRTAIGSDRIVVKNEPKTEPKLDPQVEYESDSDLDEDELLSDEIGNVANVSNLPHGMTETRLKTLAGSDVQNLVLDKEERSAKITFKTTITAENFKRKFNNKMVAASRLTVTLQ